MLDKEVIDMIRENNVFLKNIQHRIEENTQRWLSSRDAAKYMGISKSTLLKRYKQRINYVQEDRGIMFDVRDIDAFMESKKKKK